jgi:taspase (threonine aspartase 1)
MLVSRNARDRYIRWREDLRRAEGRMTPRTPSANSSQTGEEKIDHEEEDRVRMQMRRDHTNAILNGTWNEGQSHSPGREVCSPECQSTHGSLSPAAPRGDRRYLNVNSPSCSRSPNSAPTKRIRYTSPSESSARTHSLLGPNASSYDAQKGTSDVSMTLGEPQMGEQLRPGSSDGHSDGYTSPVCQNFPPCQHGDNQTAPSLAFSQEGTAESPSKPFQKDNDDDMIIDTVGAIAIDMYGNIAAGSSSGGIGMKHRGRVGPAALVGVGTAVIPADPRDEEGKAVAAVTSGTGEHMATTMASQKCAERLYHSTRRATGGVDIDANDSEAMESFVQVDFMNHPGVFGSNSTGAIGVMAVKKTSTGYYLYWAHNTDSFALASMHSGDREPKCVMSRIGENANVIQGGRKIRIN